MNKQITDTQAFALSFTTFKYEVRKTDEKGRTQYDKKGEVIYEIFETTRFIKPGESQTDALKRLRNSALGRTKKNKYP
jgi:hypothetical protein